MIYNDRVTIVTEKYGEGQYGEEIYLGEVEEVIPANRSRLTGSQQMGYFGTYNKKAFKLHLQGIHEDIERIKYKDIPYDITDAIYLKNATVLIIS
jgi:hypothetical protein